MGEAYGKLAENLRKITRKSDWTLVNGDKIGQTKLRKFSGIKLLKKAVKKVSKKVSGHTYTNT